MSKRHKWTLEDELVVFMSNVSNNAVAEFLGIPVSSVRLRRWNAACYLSGYTIGLQGGAKQTMMVADAYGPEYAGRVIRTILIRYLTKICNEVGLTRVGQGPHGKPIFNDMEKGIAPHEL